MGAALDTPPHRPVWASVLCADLARLGHDPGPALVAAGFAPGALPDPETRVPFHWITDFFEGAAAQTGDDLLGFRFGTRIDVRDAGLIAFVGINSATLRDGLKNTAAYSRVMGEGVVFDLSRFDSEGAFVWRYRLPTTRPARQYAEWYAAAVVATLRHISGSRMVCRDAAFLHPRPGAVPEMDRFFGCTARFGADDNLLLFSQDDLDRPVVNADRKLLDFLVGIARETMSELPPEGPDLRHRVERAILARLAAGEARAGRVAADLGMSARTLGRRLGEGGLSFAGLLRDLRIGLATRYLRESDLSLSQIAYLLGYGDASAFVTAYRRETGRTPGQVRREAAA